MAVTRSAILMYNTIFRVLVLMSGQIMKVIMMTRAPRIESEQDTRAISLKARGGLYTDPHSSGPIVHGVHVIGVMLAIIVSHVNARLSRDRSAHIFIRYWDSATTSIASKHLTHVRGRGSV